VPVWGRYNSIGSMEQVLPLSTPDVYNQL
jgi:hypothetical protein